MVNSEQCPCGQHFLHLSNGNLSSCFPVLAVCPWHVPVVCKHYLSSASPKRNEVAIIGTPTFTEGETGEPVF